MKFTTLYEIPKHSLFMKTNQFQETNTWNMMVHAPFKKVVKFDLFCMGLGVVMGIGVGAFLVAGV